MTTSAALPVFSEGIAFDGASILRDGVMMTVGEILEALTTGAGAEARVKELEEAFDLAEEMPFEFRYGLVAEEHDGRDCE